MTAGHQLCTPPNVYGPFKQTLFLGCSVKSFSCTMGWNEQSTSITVELVEDPCKPVGAKDKVYYPKPGVHKFWNKADPGFSFPSIGSPVYFRIGAGTDPANTEDFEFAGVVQSWTQTNSSDGNPTYSVNISDPRFLLQNLEIIISDYAGSVENVYNLVNAYGYLESDFGYLCYDAFIGGAKFGSPAGPATVGPWGFGGALSNENGTPWAALKPAIQSLLTGNNGSAGARAYSPHSYAVFRGNSNIPTEYMGELAADLDIGPQNTSNGWNGNGKAATYYVDISEIPFAPTFYRLSGPSMNLLDIISQVSSDAGCDYYVELMITPQLDKIIKIRCAKRRTQPTLGTNPPAGEIADFIDAQTGVTTKNLGRELRNEPTQVFLYGGYVQTPYQQLYGYKGEIVQHWGYDTEGYLNPTQRVAFGGMPLWEVNLDLRGINIDLHTPLGADRAIVDEQEFRYALGDFDSWINWAMLGSCRSLGSGKGTPLGALLRSAYDMKATFNIPVGLKNAVEDGLDIDAFAGNIQHNLGKINAKFALQDNTSRDKEDVKKVHAWLASYADEHYGKKFLVRLPFVCYYYEPDSGQTLYSDLPTSDGGYPAPGAYDILSLTWPGTGIDFFSDDKGKIQCFGRFIGNLPIVSGSGVGSGNLTDELGESFIQGQGRDGHDSVWVKAEVEEKIINYYNNATALITFPGPVKYSGQEVGADDNYAGTVEILAQHGIPATTGQALIRFDPKLGKGDVSMGKAKKRVTPDQAMVPMKSNTTRYGPWGMNGPPGPVKFEQDDGLVPWEWGGPQGLISYTTMSAAAMEKVIDGLTLMQVGERGGFTLPGFPVKKLGEEIMDATKMYGTLVLTTSSTTPPYKEVVTTATDGAFGPNITSIATSINDGGATTTFEFSTFTPSFGRMAKLNADRIKKAADTRSKLFRQMRDQKKFAGKLKAASEKASKQIKDIKKEGDKSVSPGSKDLVVGKLPKSVERKATTTSPPTSRDDVEKKDGYRQPVAGDSTVREKGASDVEKWKHTSVMSQDGYLRPVSRFQGGGSWELPRYTVKIDSSCTGIPHQTEQITPPLDGGPGKNNTYPEISTLYLDPMASPATPKHANSGDVYDFHTDVVSMGFEDAPPSSINLYEWEEAGKAHPEDVRFMALRGPLVMHGWGYDLEGKPVPNLADSEDNAQAGTFESTNLTNKFLDKWLRKPHTWPLAPVDLRLDRKRGVWTVPNSFRIIHARITGGDLLPGEDSKAVQMVNGGSIYDGEGNEISDGNIHVYNPEWSPSISSGGYFYAYYDTLDCKYYPIIPSGGGGSGGGGDGGSGCCSLVSDCNPCCDRIDANTFTGYDWNCHDFSGCFTGTGGGLITNHEAGHLVFNSGIKLETISGSMGDDANKIYVSAERFVMDRDSSGTLMPLVSDQKGAVTVPPCEGEEVAGRGWFKDLTFSTGLSIIADPCANETTSCGWEIASTLVLHDWAGCSGCASLNNADCDCHKKFAADVDGIERADGGGGGGDDKGVQSSGQPLETLITGPGIKSRYMAIKGSNMEGGNRHLAAHELRLGICVDNIPCCGVDDNKTDAQRIGDSGDDCDQNATTRSICNGKKPENPTNLVGGAGISISGLDGDHGECFAVFNTTLMFLDEKETSKQRINDPCRYTQDSAGCGINNYCADEISTGVFNVSQIKLGCGLQMSGGYEPCGETERCVTTLSLNPCVPAATGVRVVKDLCCSGDGFRVQYTTLRFTECGLFTGVINDDPDC